MVNSTDREIAAQFIMAMKAKAFDDAIKVFDEGLSPTKVMVALIQAQQDIDDKMAFNKEKFGD